MNKKNQSPLLFESDGSVFIRETMSFPISEKVVEQVITEAKAKTKSGGSKKLVVSIAAIHEGITKNFTNYPKEELELSVSTWTSPYNKPIVVDHGRSTGFFGREYPVEDILGRIVNVTMGEHAGKAALIFTTHITDPSAVERIKDGRYSTVSIGAKIKSAKCSVCENDWAKGKYCDHERGRWYKEDEEDEKSKAILCTWDLGGLEGIELSFVTMPADQSAGVLSARESVGNESDEASASFFYVDDEAIEQVTDEGGIRVGESQHAGILLEMLESVHLPTTSEEDDSVNKKKEPVQVEDTEDKSAEAPAEEPEAEGTSDEKCDVCEDPAVTHDTDGTPFCQSCYDYLMEQREKENEGAEDTKDESEDESQAAGDEPEDEPEVTDAEAGENSDEEILVETTSKYHKVLVTLLVERAKTEGTSEEDLEALEAELTEKDLDELELLSQKESEGTASPAEIVDALSKVAENVDEEDMPLATGNDRTANADDKSATTSEEVSEVRAASKEKVGKTTPESVTLTAEDGEVVVIRAKARR